MTTIAARRRRRARRRRPRRAAVPGAGLPPATPPRLARRRADRPGRPPLDRHRRQHAGHLLGVPHGQGRRRRPRSSGDVGHRPRRRPNGIGETLIRAVPYFLAGLATAIPARAGLFNIGGEGQLLLGAIGAAGMARLVPDSMPTPLALTFLIARRRRPGRGVGRHPRGAPAGLPHQRGHLQPPAQLRRRPDRHLAVLRAVEGPARASGRRTPSSSTANERLPILWGARVHAGILIALAVGVARAGSLLRSTTWGFKLGCSAATPRPPAGPASPSAACRSPPSCVGGAIGRHRRR